MLEVYSKIESNGSFVVANSMPLHSGAYGIPVKGSIEVSNLTAGESVAITADGVQVVNVAENGVHSFKFRTKRNMDSNIVEVGYSVSGVGVADVKIVLDVPNP